MTKLATDIQTFLRDCDGARWGTVRHAFSSHSQEDFTVAFDAVVVQELECGDDDCSKIVYFA